MAGGLHVIVFLLLGLGGAAAVDNTPIYNCAVCDEDVWEGSICTMLHEQELQKKNVSGTLTVDPGSDFVGVCVVVTGATFDSDCQHSHMAWIPIGRCYQNNTQKLQQEVTVSVYGKGSPSQIHYEIKVGNCTEKCTKLVEAHYSPTKNCTLEANEFPDYLESPLARNATTDCTFPPTASGSSPTVSDSTPTSLATATPTLNTTPTPSTTPTLSTTATPANTTTTTTTAIPTPPASTTTTSTPTPIGKHFRSSSTAKSTAAIPSKVIVTMSQVAVGVMLVVMVAVVILLVPQMRRRVSTPSYTVSWHRQSSDQISLTRNSLHVSINSLYEPFDGRPNAAVRRE